MHSSSKQKPVGLEKNPKTFKVYRIGSTNITVQCEERIKNISVTLRNDPPNLSLCKQVGFDNVYTSRRDPALEPGWVETQEGRRVLFQCCSSCPGPAAGERLRGVILQTYTGITSSTPQSIPLQDSVRQDYTHISKDYSQT